MVVSWWFFNQRDSYITVVSVHNSLFSTFKQKLDAGFSTIGKNLISLEK